MKSGLLKVHPDHRDFSLLHSYGSLTQNGLPDTYSTYGGQTIPNQEENDTRFPFTIPPLPQGCTGEAGAFETGIQDNDLNNPQDLYLATPPGDPYSGRNIRDMLQVLIDRGVKNAQGILSPKRLAYFNCYGSGAIDDYDACRLGLYVNQNEKRSVYIGSYWPWGDSPPAAQLYTPQYSTAYPLHCYLCTGWTPDGLEIIPWIGENVGNKGIFYVSREIFNNLMAVPWTGAYTITKVSSATPLPVGAQAYIDHITYWVRNLFNI